MKTKTLLILLFISVFYSLVADEIFKNEYMYVINAIESYLNKDKSIFPLILFECRRNSSYHNGYEPNTIGYDITNYPYKKVYSKNISLDKAIANISIDMMEMNIIIDMRMNNKWYGFISKISYQDKIFKINHVPNLLNEKD